MKKFCLAPFLFALIFSGLHAAPLYVEEEDLYEWDDEYEQVFDQRSYMVAADPTDTNTNAMTRPEGITPARPVLQNGCGLSLKAEAIVWQATIDNFNYGLELWDYDTTPPLRPSSIDPLTLDFDWDWGFRVGAGYTFTRDSWDIALEWTHIKNTSSSSTKVDALSDPGFIKKIAQVWILPTVEAVAPTVAEGSWKVNLDQVDLQLGREFYVGSRLTLRPKVGARTAFIYQKFFVKNFNPDTGSNSTEFLKNQFWGFGFNAGFDTDWHLGAGFSLFGDAGFSLLFGYFKVKEVGEVSLFPKWSVKSSIRSQKPVFDLGMGLKWAHKFWDEKFGVTLKAGYEYHLYMGQNQLQYPVGSTDLGSFVPLGGDLGYQGVSLSAQFDF